MTNEQKSQIRRMREEGIGYGQISTALSLSKNTVKSFCQRNGLSGKRGTKQNQTSVVFCPNCGKPVDQTPGRKRRRFCSGACRQEWWNHHLEQVNRKAVYHFTCVGCGRPFSAYGNAHRKYCSHACYINARFRKEAVHDE